jgi:hypothetical protein
MAEVFDLLLALVKVGVPDPVMGSERGHGVAPRSQGRLVVGSSSDPAALPICGR